MKMIVVVVLSALADIFSSCALMGGFLWEALVKHRCCVSGISSS